LSAVPDCLPSVTELFRSPLLVSGTVFLINDRVTSAPSVAVFRSRLKTVTKPTCLTFHTLPPCDCTVPAQWRLVTLDTLIVPVYLLTLLQQSDFCGCWNVFTPPYWWQWLHYWSTHCQPLSNVIGTTDVPGEDWAQIHKWLHFFYILGSK